MLSGEAKERRSVVIARKATITARLSENTRTIAVGALASCYALLIADEEVLALFAPVRWLLLSSALFAMMALALDLLQYVCGYINVEKALDHPEQGFPKDWSHKGQQHCFRAKLVLTFLGALALVAAIGATLF